MGNVQGMNNPAAQVWSNLLGWAHGGPSGMQDAGGDGLFLHPLYGPIAAARSMVVGQLGQSLDGRIATETGHSHYVNGPEALMHLHRLRALVDAVVVGVGTVQADNPRLTVRHVPGPDPVRVVIDPDGRMDRAAHVATDGGRTVMVHAAGVVVPPGVEGIVLDRHAAGFAPGDIVAALTARGLRRLLIEGGARTVSAFLAAGALHRLHVCVAPLLIGSGLPGLTLPPVARLDDALRPPAAVYRLGADVLFDLDLA